MANCERKKLVLLPLMMFHGRYFFRHLYSIRLPATFDIQKPQRKNWIGEKWKCVQNLCNLHRMGLYCAPFSYINYPHSNSDYLNFLSMRFCLLNIFMSKCFLNLLGFLEPILEFDDGLISALKQTNISAYTTTYHFDGSFMILHATL